MAGARCRRRRGRRRAGRRGRRHRAGPAGLAVTLVDKARFPRDKICGDGLTAGALRLLEGLGSSPVASPSWQRVDDVVVRAPSGPRGDVPAPPGPGHLRRGGPADRPRRRAARHGPSRRGQGARRPRLRRGGRARRPRGDPTSTASARSTAAYAIAADGMWSPLRKHLGLATPGYRGEWHAFRQYFTGVGPRPHASCSCGSSPTSCRATPGRSRCPAAGPTWASASSEVARSSASRTWRLWPDLLARPHIRRVLGRRRSAEAPHRAWPIPARIDDVVLDRPPHAVRRRRRRRHRPADRRGHRPGAAHRHPGRRGHRRHRRHRRRPPGWSPRGYRRAVRAVAGGRPPHVDAAHPGACATARACGRCCGWRARPTGPAATSPAGCSRTTPAPCWPRRAAGTAACSLDQARTSDCCRGSRLAPAAPAQRQRPRRPPVQLAARPRRAGGVRRTSRSTTSPGASTETYGETPIRYLTRRRIERAQDLLRSANLTVTEVCMLVGLRQPRIVLGTLSRAGG